MVLDWNKVEIPLAAGLDTKGDLRAGRPPKLDIARDVVFGEPGGVQTRLPLLNFSNQIFGGGTLANCRRLAVVNDELCVFTDTGLYSWNARLAKWVLRATHLAVSVDERPAFVTSDDQVTPDRAELNGTVLYAWSVNVSGGSVATYLAAFDKVTSAVLMSPTLVPNVFRPRLVALATTILFFAQDLGNGMGVMAINPANPAASVAGGFSSVLTGTANLYYDVARAGTQDLCVGVVRRTVTTSYHVFNISPTLAITGATKARTADGPVAICSSPDGTQTQIVRANGTNIQGDLLTTSTLADVLTGQAIGTAASTTINQVTASFALANVVRAFWTSGTLGENTTGNTIEMKTNADTSGAPGSQASLVLMAGISSRAFSYAGRVYVWLAFAQDNIVSGLSGAVSVGVRAQLQNTYFLYRDDGLLVSKALFDVAGGHSAVTGHLPGVVSTSVSGLDFAWCGTRRRTIDLGGAAHEGFEARSPVDVRFSFDSDFSRRSAALGRTLYIADSIPLQYDGVGLLELGFLIYPYGFFVTTGGGGSIAAGDYVYKSTLAWTNALGEKERSTTAMGAKITAPGANKNAIQVSALNYTRKVAAGAVPTVEVWRTAVNPPDDAPFFLTSGKDPSVLAGGGTNNAYIPNDVSSSFVPSTGFFTFGDSFADAVLITKEKNPENGAVLESLAPPGASLIVTTDARVFIGGVPGDADAVWYSRLRNEGEVASFHDTLRIAIPRARGVITALAFNNETLTVFRESAIYALPGDGFNNLGQGSNYGPARLISSDVGAISQETVALTPLGLVFKSSKGWYLLTPSWQLRYIGAQVSAFDADTVTAVTVVETDHHVRILTSNRLILWDYSAVTEESPLGQWGEWTVSGGLDAVMWQGQYVVLSSTGPAAQQTTHSGLTYGLDAETTWLKPTELQGEFFLRWLAALGEYRSSCLLRFRLARDYLYDGAGNAVYFDDYAWSPTPTVVGSALQVKHPPSVNRMQALKVRLTAVTDASRASLVTTALSPQVATSAAVWNATWRAERIGHRLTAYGEMGNRLTMSVAFTAFTPVTSDLFSYDLPFPFESETALVVVKDHYTYSGGRWIEDLDNVGVLVAGTLTVAELEAAIAEASALVTLSAADASPTKVINVNAMIAGGLVSTAGFAGGAYGSPTGEALKLTGLALEIGVARGINKRLPAEQTV